MGRAPVVDVRNSHASYVATWCVAAILLKTALAQMVQVCSIRLYKRDVCQVAVEATPSENARSSLNVFTVKSIEDCNDGQLDGNNLSTLSNIDSTYSVDIL